MNSKQIEKWSPWVLLVAVLVLWQGICSIFNVSEFIFQIGRASCRERVCMLV